MDRRGQWVDLVDHQPECIVDGNQCDPPGRDVVGGQLADDLGGGGWQRCGVGWVEYDVVGVEVQAVAARGTRHVCAKVLGFGVDEQPVDLAWVGGQS